MMDILVEQAHKDGITHLVVGAYILQDNKILLLRRSENEDFLPGYVELPSGGVDPHETLDQALHREVKEETNLTITSIDRYINFFDYVGGSGKKVRQYNFSVTITDPTHIKLNPDEHDEFYWVEMKLEKLNAHFSLSDKTKNILLEALPQLVTA
jgi:8-oxo-dGTP diphosphatase